MNGSTGTPRCRSCVEYLRVVATELRSIAPRAGPLVGCALHVGADAEASRDRRAARHTLRFFNVHHGARWTRQVRRLQRTPGRVRRAHEHSPADPACRPDSEPRPPFLAAAATAGRDLIDARCDCATAQRGRLQSPSGRPCFRLGRNRAPTLRKPRMSRTVRADRRGQRRGSNRMEGSRVPQRADVAVHESDSEPRPRGGLPGAAPGRRTCRFSRRADPSRGRRAYGCRVANGGRAARRQTPRTPLPEARPSRSRLPIRPRLPRACLQRRSSPTGPVSRTCCSWVGLPDHTNTLHAAPLYRRSLVWASDH